MDRALPTATELRLLGFATAVLGAVAGSLAALAGHHRFAVAVGVRVTGLGLVAMGVATLRSPAALAGPGGRDVELLRGAVLLVVGVVLAVVPWAVVAVVR